MGRHRHEQQIECNCEDCTADGYCHWCTQPVQPGGWHVPDWTDIAFCSPECANEYSNNL